MSTYLHSQVLCGDDRNVCYSNSPAPAYSCAFHDTSITFGFSERVYTQPGMQHEQLNEVVTL